MKKSFLLTKIILGTFFIMLLFVTNSNATSVINLDEIELSDELDYSVKKATLKEGKKLKGLKKLDLSKAEKLLSDKKINISKNNNDKTNILEENFSISAASNHDPSNALYINLDTVYNDYLTEDGQQNWYYVYVPTAGKITTYLQTIGGNVDYDLSLYKLNMSTYSLENPSYSTYGSGMNEQISYIVEPGYYFINISSYYGFDTANPYYFITKYSSSYDSAEPDDNIWSAPSKIGDNLILSQTIDNEYDVDWMKIEITTGSSVYMNLGDVTDSHTYEVDIFDMSLNGIGTLEQDITYTISLNPGDYYLRIRSVNGYNGGYCLTINKVINEIDTVYGIGDDGNYVLYSSIDGELYVNNVKISSNKKLEWERVYYFSYGGGYTQRTQEINGDVTDISNSAIYGSYTSNYTSTINNAFRIPVSNVLYTYFYSTFQSGVPTYYEKNWYDVTGMRTPRTTDAYDDIYFGPLYLIINADTGVIEDLDADLNFYYYNNIESRTFTQK